MNLLIDYYISEEFDFLNSLLKGQHVPGKISKNFKFQLGLFGLSREPKKEKEIELDLKFLDEIY